MAGQKGTEYTLCLDSANRDEQAYPEPNDFTLELKDRYDLQMMVLGSFEFPHNQWTIEPAWSTFCFDVGSSFFSEEARSVTFQAPFAERVVMVPAPFTAMRRETITSDVYHTLNGRPHGLGVASLEAFPIGSVRIILMPCSAPTGVAPELPVIRVLSPTRLLVRHGEVAASSCCGLLAVTSANTRTFLSPLHLAECLSAYCRKPFPGQEALARWHFTYDAPATRLSLEIRPALSRGRCEEIDPGCAFVLPDVLPRTELLFALGFNPPLGKPLPGHLVALPYPVKSTCGVRADVTEPVCVQIPPGNYDQASLRLYTEQRMNATLYLTIPQAATNPDVDLIRVWGWGQPLPDLVKVAALAPINLFHPEAVAQQLTASFCKTTSGQEAHTQLIWSFEDDRFIARPLDAGRFFRIIWPTGDYNQQMLALRLGIDESACQATELVGEIRHFCPSPTQVYLPTSHEQHHINSHKQFIFKARPKLQPGSAPTSVPVLEVPDLGPWQIGIELGVLPLETPVIVSPPEYSPTHSQFGVVVAFVAPSPCGDCGYSIVQLLSDGGTAPPGVVQAGWLVTPIPLSGGSVNLYFPPVRNERSRACWSRLAEIYGFHSGANLWRNPLIAPAQWNFEQPAYVLLDLGLQHMSATITHRCGEDVLTQFFGKIVLYPNFKEQRMTPIQAIGTGVSVISSLHFRILNPWHQLYELHGRNWSITVILATLTKGALTECP